MPIKEKKVYDADIEENKLMASFSYLWILCLVPLFLKRQSKFAQFHAKQGFILLVVEVIMSVLMWIPVIGKILFIGVIILAILGFIKAYNGEYWKMPFIYKWSQKINL